MYQHADQSWKNKPLIFSPENQDLLAYRLEEYVKKKGLERILVIFHGGEPLIFGCENIISLSQSIKTSLRSLGCRVDFGIQTNGTLLKKSSLEQLAEENISVSLSIDGPREMHNEHRVDHKGKTSFDKVYAALTLLKQYPQIFSGCIAVINPNFKPKEVFEFFSSNGLKEFNILLPDANYINPPKWREKDKEIYKNWLTEAYDCWVNEYPEVICKFFESIYMSLLGQGGQSDAFGLGDVSLLNIETDGSYHDLDVLKITEEGYSNLGMSLKTHPIEAAERAEKIQYHRHLLTKEGLCDQCKKCPHVDVCGGGSVPHRFSNEGFKNPTIYCEEMYHLIDHVTEHFEKLVEQESKHQDIQLLPEFNKEKMEEFWNSKSSFKPIEELKNHQGSKSFVEFQHVLNYIEIEHPEYQNEVAPLKKKTFTELKKLFNYPPFFAWLRVAFNKCHKVAVTNADGKNLDIDLPYLSKLNLLLESSTKLKKFIIHEHDNWYQKALGESIVLDHSDRELSEGREIIKQSLEIIKSFSEAMHHEILLVSPHIQLVKDKKADPDKDVSFSDETLPGAIFIGVWKREGTLSPYMIAASIIHEHLHQKLYLLQQRFELFPAQDTLVYSPWPKLNRPPKGALHAVYVFTYVACFWLWVAKHGQCLDLAEDELSVTLERLEQCISEIKQKVIFTEIGKLFFNCLLEEYKNLVNSAEKLHVNC